MIRDDEIFANAIALPAGERVAFVQRECTDDGAAGARLAVLLANYERAQTYFEHPLVRVAAPWSDERSGEVIGRYTLVEKLGEGGCGVVWLAEQSEPVRRSVALKVIKLGMDTREVCARFEAERQALAIMDHPSIARVFDGGATAGGRPYFVMELVHGVPITRYCDQHQLAPAQRIELFITVCHAVQHAHQKGVIHRDLKPSNILVADGDARSAVERVVPDALSAGSPPAARGQAAPPASRGMAKPFPKVIDFGIAKATQGRLTEHTFFTAVHQFIGTPAYMSPEQVEIGSADIDTRSDIYSLGVLLYELLTGETPFDRKSVSNGGVDALRERLRTIDPPRPSNRFRTLDHATRTTIARLRGSSPAQLSVLLRSDLDWIVMRCLEKDRARRYDTVNGLALDLARHLRHEPVVARPPSTAYVLGRMIRRHRVVFAAVGVIAGVLVLGVMVSMWQAIRATRAEHAARHAAGEQNRLRQEAEARQREEASRWSRSDMAAATRFVAQGKTQEGLAFLVHAGQLDRENRLVATRLLTALASRSYVRPYAPTIRLPAALEPARYYNDLSPDGRMVGVRGADHVFRLVNFETAQVEHEIKLGPKVTHANFFRNTLVVGGGYESIDYFDPVTGVLRSRWRMSDNYSAGSRLPSNDGRWAAIVDGATIKIWDVVAARLTATIAETGRPRGLNFSPDGSRLGSIHANGGIVRIWSVPDGRKLLEVVASDLAARAGELMYSHDNRTLALLQRGGVQLHDGATGKARGPLLRCVPGGTEPVFTPDDSLVIVGARDRMAHAWRVDTGEPAFPPLRHSGAVGRPQVVANGRVLFTESSDGYRYLWNLTNGQPVVEPFQSAEGARVSVGLDGRRLVEVTPAGELRRFWAEANTAEPLVLPRGPEQLGVEWDPDRPAILRRITQRRLIPFEVATGRDLPGSVEFPEPVSNTWISANGKVLLVRTAAGDFQAWTLGHEKPSVVKLEQFPVVLAGGHVILNREGSLALVLLQDDREMRVWNLRTGRPVAPAMRYHDPITGNYNGFNGSFSPDNRWVATGAMGDEGKVWEVETGRLVHALQPLRRGIRRVEFTPDGRRIATTDSSDGARLWDAATGQPISPLFNLRGQQGAMVPAGFSHDGRWLLNYAFGAGSVAVWDARTGGKVGAQIEHGITLVAPPVFSPDDSRIVTTGADNALRIWEARTGLPLAEPMRQGGPVNRVSFSPDGRFILTRGSGQLNRIWAAPPAADGPVPDWLLRLATLQAGMVVNDDGNPVAAPADLAGWDELRTEIDALPANAPYAAWGKWLVASRELRPIAPGFAITLAEAGERGLIGPVVAAVPRGNVAAPLSPP